MFLTPFTMVRCFVLSHPAVPLRPLAILHVALTSDISSSIHSIISRPVHSASLDGDSLEVPSAESEDTRHINTAIFYSVSSTQKGLAVSFRVTFLVISELDVMVNLL